MLDGWVCWFDLEGKLLPTRAETERERAAEMERRVKALEAELGRSRDYGLIVNAPRTEKRADRQETVSP